MSTFISYAQNFEDVLLWRALKHVASGFYIDIGANSPVVDSVSLAFYENGWTGINVEPSLQYALQLSEKRVKDLNLHAAIAEERGLLKFYDVAETGLSTLLKEVAEEHARAGFQVSEAIVPTITLDDLLADVSKPDVHWMKIDVEGAERQVLQGWKTSAVRPWIVVVESVLPVSHEESYAVWEKLLLDKGYRFAFFDGLNRYFVSQDHLDLLDAFQVGPNVFDRFCLSGTATSTFCAVVNHKALESAEALAVARDELSQSIEQRNVAETTFSRREEEQQKALASTFAQLEESLRQNASLNEGFLLAENESKELRNRMVQILSEHRGLVQERNQALDSVGRIEYALSVSKAEMGALATEQEFLAAELRQSTARIQGQEGAIRSLEGQLSETLSSSSWRITAPFRLMSSMVRGSRAGMSKHFRETLRNMAEVPALTAVARRVLPDQGRLKRFLVSRMTTVGPSLSAPVAAGAETYSPNALGSERNRLLIKMAKRIREDRPHREKTE